MNLQIQTFQTSDFTSEIWELVQGHKQTASDTHLGLLQMQNTNLQKTPSGKIQAQKKALEKAVPGIARGITHVEEMKNKRDQGKKIRLTVSLAMDSRMTKLSMVSTIHIIHNADEDAPISEVLDQVVGQVQQCHWQLFPMAALIFKQMATFYAVETTTKFYFLTEEHTVAGTVSDLLRHYLDQQIITQAQFDAKAMELKFSVKLRDLYPDSDGVIPSSAIPFSVAAASTSQRTLAKSKAPTSSSHTALAPLPSSQRHVCASAWRNPNPTRPRCYTVESFDTWVSFSMPQDTKVKTIFMASVHPRTQPATPGPGTAALTILKHDWAALTTLKYDQAVLTTYVHKHAARSGHICAPQHVRILSLDPVFWGTAIVHC
ncbi:hypothetical protein B0H17DRAFT_1132322 [Mycena rosella]|uniref:Uncharacterized protein n=1 Tax=Mycena rosella TaxID=1033263 RepID=A0AAD7GJN6_MYCRO|nr:hypothetical protein B0H17DRAFT_1132322 [Mycena rosella]